jgi:cytochrome c peroxidase
MQPRVTRNAVGISVMALSLVVSGLGAGMARADGGLVPLSKVAVPQPAGSDIMDQAAAVRLGKALFWDVQTGGDGQIACATCHYNAGADGRVKNSVNPGPDGLSGTADDILGSQGIVFAAFNKVFDDPDKAADDCDPHQPAPGLRQVTGRQAPSVIGAVYNRDNFWDGRANHNFNGLDPFGATGNAGGSLGGVMGNSSLASQADGPANNQVEMSCAGRPFNGNPLGHGSLGTKMLDRQPLQPMFKGRG